MGLLFGTLYGPAPPENNETRFRNAQYDRAFEGFLRAPDAKTRNAHARVMSAITAAYAPMIPLMVDVENAFVQPWVTGYNRSPFATYYKFVDIDLARRP
jgi:ABC-type transport system substrate-binding protein